MQERQLNFGVLINQEWADALESQKGVFDAVMYALAAGHCGVRLYFFRCRDVNLRRGALRGWVPQSSVEPITWAYQEVPCPDVYYDQIKLPHLDHTRLVSTVRRRLAATSISLNPVRALPKWKTHVVLSRFPDVAGLLPETQLCRSPRSIAAMLRRHRAVLAKPDRGSWGQGISRITRAGRGRYALQLSAEDKRWRSISAAGAYAICTLYAGGDRVLLQQQIPLMETSAGEVSDMRVVTSKNRQGEWEVTQSFLRMAAPGRFTTNWHQGARNETLAEGLPLLGITEREVPQVVADLHLTALRVAARLEQGFGRLAEIGIDLALDRGGRMWLIEANASPDKGTDSSDRWEPVPHIFLNIVEYAQHLAEQHAPAAQGSRPGRLT